MALKMDRLAVALISLGALVTATACAAGASSAPTATPPPTATATPVPVESIMVDPEVDPAGFLAELPSSEVDCASSAVGGRDKLEQLVSFSEGNADGISDTQLRVLASCISDETVERVIVGQLELQTGGLTDATVDCINNYTDGIDFATMFSGQAVSSDTIISTLQAMFCLTPEERTALETSNQQIIEVSELGGIDALECAIDGAGTGGLDAFSEMFSPDGAVDPLAVGEFMPLLIDCGVVDDADLESSSGVSADEFACLFQELDSDTLAKFMSFADDPSASPDLSSAVELLGAMDKCGLDFQAILDSAGSTGTEPSETPTGGVTVSSETLFCLTDNGVSATLASSYAAGLADPSDPDLVAALEICANEDPDTGEGEGVVVPDGNGGSTTIDPSVFDTLPITAEQAQCLINEIGVDQLEGVASGTTNPLAILGALGACEISLTDLIAAE